MVLQIYANNVKWLSLIFYSLVFHPNVEHYEALLAPDGVGKPD